MAEALKDSKVTWLGVIPDNWSVDRTKFHYTNLKQVAGVKSKDYERLALTLNGVIKRPKDDADGLQPGDFNGYQILKTGDLVFKLIDLQNISTSRVGLAHDTGIVSPAYIRLEPKKKESSRYGEYYFLSMWQREIFNQLGDAGVRSNLSSNDLLELPYIRLPYDEQVKIADFLDEKCAEIELLTKDIQSQINLLEEYRKSIIAQVVTKGLRARNDMKESGVVAIGDIPSTWKLCRIKNLFIDNKNGIKVGPFGSALGQAVVSKYDGEYKVYGQANLIRRDFTYGDNYVKKKDYERLIAYRVLPGDIAVSMMGTIGKCMVVPADIEDGIMDSHLIKIRLKKGYNPNYFEYLYESDAVYIQLLLQNKGSIMTGLNSSIVKNIYFLEPPVEEQNEIVNYLDDICSKINSSIRAKNEQIVKMDAYKKSIIYEYVTGKKRVKGAL